MIFAMCSSFVPAALAEDIPSVRITSPENHRMYKKVSDYVPNTSSVEFPSEAEFNDLGAEITVSAAASGDVSAVRFYNKGVLIDAPVSVSGGEYAVTLTGCTDPDYVFTAEALTADGVSVMSEPVTVFTNLLLKRFDMLSSLYDDENRSLDAGSNLGCLVDGKGNDGKDYGKGNKFYMRYNKDHHSESYDYVTVNFGALCTLWGTNGYFSGSSQFPQKMRVEYADENGDWQIMDGTEFGTDNLNTSKKIEFAFDTPVCTDKIRWYISDLTENSAKQKCMQEIEAYGYPTRGPSITLVSPQQGASADVDDDGNLTVVISAADEVGTVEDIYITDSNGTVHRDYTADADGNYSFKIPISDFGTVVYSVNAANSRGVQSEKEISFVIVPRSIIINEINNASDSELDGIFAKYEQNLAQIGFDIDGYKNLKSDDIRAQMCRFIKSNCPFSRDEQGEAALRETFALALATAMINQSESIAEMKDAVEKSAGEFGINIGDKSDYAKLENTDAVYSAMLADKAKEYFDTKSAVTLSFRRALVLPLINELYWGELPQIFEDYADILDLPLDGSWASLTESEKSNVCVAVKNSSPTDVSRVRSAFDAAVAAELAARNSGSSSSSSGGGSSKPGKGLSIAPVPKTDESDNIAPTDSIAFSDISDVPWAAESIKALYEKGVINGVSQGVFEPHRSVTREEFVKMAAKLFELKQSAKDISFDDVSADDYFADSVYAAAESGIINGYGRRFGVGESISRQDAAVIAYRLILHSGRTLGGTVLDFNDSGDIADYARDAVAHLAASAVINGNGGAFNPLGSASRAEAAKILYETWKICR